MPISKDSQFIKDVGRRLGTALTGQEIDLLCLVGNESESLRYAARGFFKHVTFDIGNESKPASYKIDLATKYLVLTDQRLIAFDDQRIHFFDTKKITFYSLWQQASLRATEIYCETVDEGSFVMMGLDDAAAIKFSGKMETYRDERDDDHTFSRAQMGMSLGYDLYHEFLSREVFTIDQVHEMFSHPEQWGSSNPRDTPRK